MDPKVCFHVFIHLYGCGYVITTHQEDEGMNLGESGGNGRGKEEEKGRNDVIIFN